MYKDQNDIHLAYITILYLNRPSIHHKYIQGVTIRRWKHMCFSDVKSYIRKQSRKLRGKNDNLLEKPV